jgi:hypothetical protein
MCGKVQRYGAAVVAVLLFAAVGLGAQNWQEIIPLGDSAYAILDDLYLEAGLARYSGARPFSAAEFTRAFERIPVGRLSRTGQASLERGLARLSLHPQYEEEGDFAFRGSLAAGLEGYLHLPIDASGRAGTPYAWSYGYEERMPIVTAAADVFAGSQLWMGLVFDFKAEYRAIDDRMSPAGQDAGRSETNHLNLVSKASDLDTFFPFRGAMAFGGDSLSVEFGRDYLDWGNGRTGNLIVSNYTDYYDFIRLAVFSKVFKFSSMFSSFTPNLGAGERFLGLTAHRLEFAPLEMLRISVTESLALGNGFIPDYVHDLNPLLIYHGWLAPERANSLMTIEVDLAPMRFVNLYGQFGVDEFQTVAETEAGSFDKATALGYLAGIRSSLPLGDGYLRAGYEFVLTDPWLYNRYAAPYYRSQRRVWSFIVPALDEWVIKPTGYGAGPDALVHDVEVAYELPGVFKAALGFGWMAKGEIDLTTPYPTAGSASFFAKTPYGVAEIRGELRLGGSWTVLPFLELNATARYIQTDNTGHVTGNTTSDVELVLGARATLR